MLTCQLDLTELCHEVQKQPIQSHMCLQSWMCGQICGGEAISLKHLCCVFLRKKKKILNAANLPCPSIECSSVAASDPELLCPPRQGKAEPGPQRYPSLLQLSSCDLMEMRVAGTAKWAVLFSGVEWKWGETREEEIGDGGGVCACVCVCMTACACLHLCLSLWLCAHWRDQYTEPGGRDKPCSFLPLCECVVVC